MNIDLQTLDDAIGITDGSNSMKFWLNDVRNLPEKGIAKKG